METRTDRIGGRAPGAAPCLETTAGAGRSELELATDEWRVEPLAVDDVNAGFFERELPAEAVEFDSALLMRDVGHEWRPRRAMTGEASA